MPNATKLVECRDNYQLGSSINNLFNKKKDEVNCLFYQLSKALINIVNCLDKFPFEPRFSTFVSFCTTQVAIFLMQNYFFTYLDFMKILHHCQIKIKKGLNRFLSPLLGSKSSGLALFRSLPTTQLKRSFYFALHQHSGPRQRKRTFAQFFGGQEGRVWARPIDGVE